MRALTVWRPWSWAIFHGKPVENRGWFPRPSELAPGERFAIHAGKVFDDDAVEFITRLGLTVPVDLPGGVIVGTVRFVDVCALGSPRCGCGPWAARGQLHWKLADPVELAKPVPCRGAQGLWRLPPDVVAAVEDQLPGQRPRGPVATTRCPDCWVDPGEEHQLSCPQVPADWFIANYGTRQETTDAA